MAAIHDTGALDYVKSQAKAEARVACEAISHLPHSKYKESLLQWQTFR